MTNVFEANEHMLVPKEDCILTEQDFVSILEAARLGVCSEDIKEEMDISDEEADRLHGVIVSIQECTA